MPRLFCVNVKKENGHAILQKSVERIIKKNQKVFDELAKS